MKNEKLWSLKIPIKNNLKDKTIQNYFKICKEKLGLIPNILKTNSIDKKKFDAFNIFYNRLMQDDNYLTKIEKEMIAVVVSTTNRCLYCCVSHSYTLAKLLKDPIKAKTKKATTYNKRFLSSTKCSSSGAFVSAIVFSSSISGVFIVYIS